MELILQAAATIAIVALSFHMAKLSGERDLYRRKWLDVLERHDPQKYEEVMNSKSASTRR